MKVPAPETPWQPTLDFSIFGWADQATRFTYETKTLPNGRQATHVTEIAWKDDTRDLGELHNYTTRTRFFLGGPDVTMDRVPLMGDRGPVLDYEGQPVMRAVGPQDVARGSLVRIVFQPRVWFNDVSYRAMAGVALEDKRVLHQPRRGRGDGRGLRSGGHARPR